MANKNYLTSITKTKLRLILLFFLAISPFLIFSSFLFLKDPLTWPDEGIFLDIANNLNTHGTLSTTLFKDAVPGLSKHAYWYPPLYFYALSIWTKAFGTSIISIRTLSVLIGIFSLATFFFLAEKLLKSGLYSALATAIIAIDPNFNQSARMARMEILVFLFMLISFLIYQTASKSNNKRALIYSGIFSSLAMVTHLIGILAPAIIIPTIIASSRKLTEKIKTIVLFAIPIVAVILAWLSTVIGNLNIFLSQMELQFAKKATTKSWIYYRWNDGQWQILIVLCLIAILIFGFYTYKNRSHENYFLLIGIIVSIFLVITGKVQWYFIFFQPFMALILTSLFKYARESSNIILQSGLNILLLIIVFINFNLIFSKLILFNRVNYSYSHYSSSILENIEPKNTVFLSVIPDPYLEIRNKNGLKFYEFPTMDVTLEKYKSMLDSSDYVVQNVSLVYPEYTSKYLSKNSLWEKTAGENAGYKTKIYKLKPPAQRDSS